MPNDDRLVYSSGPGSAQDRRKDDTSRDSKGRRAPGAKPGKSKARSAADPADGVARVRRESKGRGGKTVTVITGLPIPEDELRDLAKELRRACGTGGSCKEGAIEIQGDHADRMVEALHERGFQAKRAGG